MSATVLRSEEGSLIAACPGQSGRRRWTGRAQTLLLVFMGVVSLLPVGMATAQPAAPTPEQMRIFQNLTPDQQRAVLEAAGAGGGAGRTDPPLATPATMLPVNGGTVPPVEEVEQGPPRLRAGSTLMLAVALAESTGLAGAAADASRQVLEDRRARILAGNPYALDSQGQLLLPFLPPIPAGGLSAEEAALRLTGDPRLAGLEFTVSLLPVEPVGVQALKPFGYDLFGAVPTTFAPATDVPVPDGYVMGPGDTVIVEYFGQRMQRYSLVVDRNGMLTIPEFGPISVIGLGFDALRADISQRVASQMIGVQVSVTMGALRSVQIFVLGEVVRPGSYTVSGLSTVTNALLGSGGVTTVGSLRNIELKRGGRTVTRLDLYDLLLRGDTSGDARLQPGDVIFVPPIGLTASIAGEVRRPAIYELRDGATMADLLLLSGGLNPASDARLARLERIDADRERAVLDLDLTRPPMRAQPLRDGDVVTIPRVLDQVARGVTLEGHVLRPGPYAWRDGMRLSDLLGSLDALQINADQRYVLIRREHMPDRRVEILSADAVRAFAARGSPADVPLQSRDRVIVFSMQRDRGTALAELLQEVRLQTRDNQPQPIVTVNGRVRAVGQYPLETGMKVVDLVRAGGGMDDAAFGRRAELTRYEVVNGESRQTEVVEFDLAAAIAGDPAANLDLRPYDVLLIKETPDWRDQEYVTLRGEVRFPGNYPIRKGETLRSVIERAGGLTDVAFPAGAVFTREEIREQERLQIETLATRMQADLSQLALQSAQTSNSNAAQAMSVGQSLLSQLRSSRPAGRLVIDLEAALGGAMAGADDLELRNGDTLVVPRLKQYVSVIGEVQNSTAHVWRRGANSEEYLGMSGGLTQRADRSRIYVVKANGSVVTASGGGRWFRSGGVELEPGDTIVVPIDTERMRPLPLWTAVTTIIYNLAVAVAAIGSI